VGLVVKDSSSGPRVRGIRTVATGLSVLRLAAALLVAGGCNLLGGGPTSEAVRIAPGECFDQPSGATDTSHVQRQLCTVPHDGEAIAASVHPAAAGAPYPTADELRTFMSSACVTAFATYTGSEYDNQSGLDFGIFYPVRDEWSSGSRDVVCYVFNVDGTKLTGSLRRGSAPSGAPTI
jgi:hypothetical protein